MGHSAWHVTITDPDGARHVYDVSAHTEAEAKDLAWEELRADSTTSVGDTPTPCDVTVGGDPFAASVPSCAVVAQDTAEDSDPRPFWGNIECESSSRYEYLTSGGDPHPAAGGAPQGNAAYRQLTVLDGDDAWGERCELGRNDHRTGPTAFYREGDHLITFVSYRPGADFPLSAHDWQVILQMKQAQPSESGGGQPVLSMQADHDQFQLRHSVSPTTDSPAETLWTTPAQEDAWTRFAFDVHYSQSSAQGSIRVYVDLNGDGDSLDDGERSPTFETHTLKRERSDSEYLDEGDSIPSHLRVGVYHDSSISCPSTGVCSGGVDNVQIVRAG